MGNVSRLGPRGLLVVAFLCFFVSGASGLIYEVVWTRMLTQVFGNTTYAVATVLTAFMAGLALGSYLLGLVADRGKNNFLFYGLLEAGVGIYGLLVPWIFKLVQSLYIPLFSLNESYPLAFNLILFLLSLIFLVVPTLLMGATLPVLSRFFIHSFSHLGQRLGDLYATNTVGAVFGCALAGYWLIPALGMHATVRTAALLNLTVAAVIFAADRVRDKVPLPEGTREAEPARVENPSALPSWSGTVLLTAIGVSGFAALVYENSWTRALTMVIGSSVYSFTTMLVTFLVGLALGGFLYARIFGKHEVGICTLGIIEVLVGATALATLPLFEKLPFLFLRLDSVIGESFSIFLAVQLLLCALVMFLPTLLLGMTFPLVAQLFTQDLYRIGRSVGTSYAANTLGAILGAFAGGFILIPTLGVENTIVLGVTLNLLVGWFLVVVDTRWVPLRRFAVGAVVLIAAVMIPFKVSPWDPHIMTSGVTIYDDTFTELPTDTLRLKEMRKDEILYYREGLTATVSVHRSEPGYLYFKTNGKIDGSHGDALTQGMLGYLPLFLDPEAKSVAVIGLGTGMTANAVGSFPVRKIDVLEIEPAMKEAAGYFDDLNGSILQDSRVRLIFTDARNYIMATPKRYDVIISEPSNPWIAGIANLFTREFYKVAKSKLSQDGIFAQWFHNYSMSADDFRMVFRTFGEAFPYISVWELGEEDFLLVGSFKEHALNAEAVQRRIDAHPDLKDALANLEVPDVRAILSFYRMGRKELLAFTAGAAINTDDGGQLEYSAPKSVRRDTSDENRQMMEPFVVGAPWSAPESVAGDEETESYVNARRAS